MDNNTTIKFSRSAYIEESYRVAIIRLNDYPHIVGQPVLVRYYTGNKKVNSIVALGILDGPGKDHYTIISNGETVPVSKVFPDRLEDVSQLVHGETVVCRLDNKVYYCYIENNRSLKKLQPITEDTVFYNGTDGFRWFYNKSLDLLKREDDFMTRNETQEGFNKIMALLSNMSPETPPSIDPGEEGDSIVTGSSFAKCSLSVTPTTLPFTGEASSVSVSYIFSFGGEELIPKSLDIMLNGETVYNTPSGSNNILVDINKRGQSTISLRAVVEVLGAGTEQRLEQSINVFMYPPVLTSISDQITVADTITWSETSVFEFPKDVIISGDNAGYLWFGIPSELRLDFEHRFLMSSIEFPVIKVNEEDLDGYDYYRTEKQQVPGTYKIRLE